MESSGAHAFVHTGTGWTEQAKLTADGAANASFGTSVAADAALEHQLASD